MCINVHNACNCPVFWWLLLTASLALAVDAFCNHIHTLETLVEICHQFSHKFTENKGYVCMYVTYVCIHEIWCKMVSCRSH